MISPIFLFVFLPVVVLAVLAVRGELRNHLLLVVSLLFYMWVEPDNFLVLISVGLVTFGSAWLSSLLQTSGKNWKWPLVLGISFNLMALMWGKGYLVTWFPFLDQSAGANGPDAGGLHGSVLIVGISFFVFTALAYLLDIYKGVSKAEHNIVTFLLHLSFFPKLISGPIVRYRQMASQFDAVSPRADALAGGARRFIRGLVKKVLIADTVAVIADAAFGSQPGDLTIGIAWLGLVAFAVQIYHDFSGYTDMALGIGQMLGFNLPENFNYPYISRSVGEFWRRWHITLSTWFRDYVFYPLERRRIRGRLNLRWLPVMVVFLLTGLWHGAAINFLIWGGIHGTAIAVERAVDRKRGRKKRTRGSFWEYFITASVLLLSWVFFRAPSFDAAAGYLLALIPTDAHPPFFVTPLEFSNPSLWVMLAVGVLLSFPVIPWIQTRVRQAWGEKPVLWAIHLAASGAYLLIFVLALAKISDRTSLSFLYMNF